MAKQRLLPARLAKCTLPFCSGCTYGKMTRCPWRTKAPYATVPKVATKPGQCVSVDQLDATVPGLIAQIKGIPTIKRYNYVTIFIDHYSKLGYVHLQQTLTSDDTVKAKQAFESYAKTYDVTVKHYHADNSHFADNAFRLDLQANNQMITFCGVNAHWQNGVAEKCIRNLTENARAMLLFAQRRWPDAITPNLWPYALCMANMVYNYVPLKDKKESPLELFSLKTILPQLQHFHHSGCPVYVLQGPLQQGQRIRKWEERARIGIYLGPSPQHAKSVALVLSLSTGNVSPQYHVQFNNLFETVTKENAQYLPKSEWQVKTHFKRVRHTKEIQTTPDVTILPPTIRPPAPPSVITPVLTPEIEQVILDQPIPEPEPDIPEAQHPIIEFEAPLQEEQVIQPLRHSTRERRQPARFADYIPHDQIAFEAIAEPQPDITDQQLQAFMISSDPDVLYLWQAMKEPDWPQFKAAMQHEIEDHQNNRHWEIVLHSTIPKHTPILPTVWSMKRKRRITTREVYKWKARLTIDGSKQKYGLHYDQTYSPVVTWPTTRFFLIQSVLHNWYSKQLDFLLAYTQAPVERELYMEVPKGVTVMGGLNDRSKYALRLIKNLYGQKQAGHVWYQYLTKGLKELGFTQSSVDECVFYKGTCVLLVYVDDTIILGPIRSDVEEAIHLIKTKFQLGEEGDLCDYLGIKVTKLSDGTITLTQPHLIENILTDLKLQSARTTGQKTPALTSVLLHKDPKRIPFDGSFHYRSVIGKLNFLEKSTQPELAYAVHQCARFCSDPKQSHGEAVKHIGRYLLSTKEQGLILKPKQCTFDCWVDASHAGEWKKETAADDIDTAKSRTGFVIMFAGCPLIWSSKLQTEIALSSTKAEYIALSTAMREVIHHIDFLQEAKMKGILISIDKASIHCKIFEDNSGAIEMA